MAQRGIREYHGKRMLAKYMPEKLGGSWVYTGEIALVDENTDWDALVKEHPWLKEKPLVAKPDQLFGKRGKHGLLLVNKNLDETKKWIKERMNKETTVGKISDTLTHFIIEPFVKHDEEYYLAIKSSVAGDTVYFSTKGGMDIESVWDTVVEIEVPANESIENIDIEKRLPAEVKGEKRQAVAKFIKALFAFYTELHYAYLEINPFAMSGTDIYPLDLVARLDDTAHYECLDKWGKDIEFPAPFGRKMSKEELYVKSLDEKTGASLKLTILNPDGRIWLLIAGGGASVIYTDTVADMGFADDLANYGEYSGDPNTELTYEYTKTVLDLMTRKKHPKGKVLLIGGGIANFTDVANTFTGIIQALKEHKDKLKEHNVKIYVRRGGPNYKEGLRKMRELGETLGVPIEVYGPEAHMTNIVRLALAN
ncbi:MAG: ATP citrate lyase citrate-binding domain-containing protein [Myxococcota bacterium]